MAEDFEAASSINFAAARRIELIKYLQKASVVHQTGIVVHFDLITKKILRSSVVILKDKYNSKIKPPLLLFFPLKVSHKF